MKYLANPIPFSKLATLILLALPLTHTANAAVVDIGGQLKSLGSLDAPAQSETADPALGQALGLVAKGDLDEAERLTRDVLKRSPASAPAFEVLGVVLAKRGQFDEALKAFEDAIRVDPRQATAYTKIGDVYTAKGQPDDAFAYYQ